MIKGGNLFADIRPAAADEELPRSPSGRARSSSASSRPAKRARRVFGTTRTGRNGWSCWRGRRRCASMARRTENSPPGRLAGAAGGPQASGRLDRVRPADSLAGGSLERLRGAPGPEEARLRRLNSRPAAFGRQPLPVGDQSMHAYRRCADAGRFPRLGRPPTIASTDERPGGRPIARRATGVLADTLWGELVRPRGFKFLQTASKSFNFFPRGLPKGFHSFPKVAKNFRESGLINGLRANEAKKVTAKPG